MIYPLKDAAGQIMGLVLVHDDITARKLAEAAVLEAHRDLGQLKSAAGVKIT